MHFEPRATGQRFDYERFLRSGPFAKGGTIAPGTPVKAGEVIGTVDADQARIACQLLHWVETEPLPIYEAAWDAVYGDLIDDDVDSNYGAYFEVGKPEGYVDAVLEAARTDAPAPSTRFAWAVGLFVGLLAIVVLILSAFGWS